MKKQCPCGSNHKYDDCCSRYIEHQEQPVTAEQLMRSRYTAYTLGKSDYLINSWHASVHAKNWRDEIERGFKQTQWLNLHIIMTAPGRTDNEAYVEFVAQYKETHGHNSNDTIKFIHERSRFLCQEGAWKYVDGITPKLDRNKPCLCGSGLKYKKCCALK